MRAPDLFADGWCLEDGERLHSEHPGSLKIPDLEVRKILQPGDFAKLIFSIAVQGNETPDVERMWVIVRSRLPGGYLGSLDSNPSCIDRNDRFWGGIELYFEPRHVIDVGRGSPTSLAITLKPPTRPWV